MNDDVAFWEREARKDPGNADKVRRLTESYRRANWTYKGQSIEAWIHQLRGQDWRAKSDAYRAVIKIGIGAVPALVELLADASAGARAYAARALGRIGPDSQFAVQRLLETLHDPDWRVRYAAATALGEVGANAAEALPILGTLRDDDGQVQEALQTSWHQIRQALEEVDGDPLKDTRKEDFGDDGRPRLDAETRFFGPA